jgi:hypothetical protein
MRLVVCLFVDISARVLCSLSALVGGSLSCLHHIDCARYSAKSGIMKVLNWLLNTAVIGTFH